MAGNERQRVIRRQISTWDKYKDFSSFIELASLHLWD